MNKSEEERIARKLAYTASFTSCGKERIYPANFYCICAGCGDPYFSHHSWSIWCSEACRHRGQRERTKQRNELRWAEDRKRQAIEAQKPKLAQRAARRLFGGTAFRITVATHDPNHNQREQLERDHDRKWYRPSDPSKEQSVWDDDYDAFLDIGDKDEGDDE